MPLGIVILNRQAMCGRRKKEPFKAFYKALRPFARQLNILYRGLELLKVGGRLVYSTCSLNPMEDESVVATALQKHQGAVRLAPPPEHLQGVLAADGLATWVVPNPEGEEVYESYESTPLEVRQGKTKLLSSMPGP